jgi:hypothetical protein
MPKMDPFSDTSNVKNSGTIVLHFVADFVFAHAWDGMLCLVGLEMGSRVCATELDLF